MGTLLDDIEENQDLRWPLSVQVYEKMRRTSGKVGQALAAITLPIRRTNYSIDPNGARDDIVERCAKMLDLPIDGQERERPTRQKGRFAFRRHWIEVQESLVFGHMPFFQVWDPEPDGLYALKKLSPRQPHTITEIKVAADGGLEWIKQNPTGDIGRFGTEIKMTIDELVWYSTGRVGANWIGLSILRQAYWHWLVQQRLIRVDAVSKERQGMGIPTVERTIQQAPTPAEESAAQELATQVRAGEFAGATVPYGYTLKLKGIEGSVPDTLASAKWHGEEIAASMLTQFLALGTTETGARAVGEIHMDVYHEALGALLEEQLDTFNQHVVEDWVDHNWGESERAPLVKADEIGEELTEEAIARLIEVGALKADKSLRSHIRTSRRLPAEDDTDEEPEPTGQTYQYDLDYQIVTIDERRAQIGLAPMPDGAGSVPPTPPAEDTGLAAANAHRARRGLPDIDQATLDAWARKGGIRITTRKPKPVKAAAEPRTYRRQLFAHEIAAKTDFETIDAEWKSALEKLLEEWKDVRQAQLDELLDQVRDLVDSGDIAGLGSLTVSTGDAADLLEGYMTDLADEAMEEAVAEAGRQGASIAKPALDTDLVSDHARRVAALMGNDLATVVGRKAGENAALGGAEAATRAADYVDTLTDTYLTDNLGGALTTAQNTGRFAAIESGNPQAVYASELLDEATCDNCADIDGKEYASLEEAQADYPTGAFYNCLGGTRCRGTLVATFDEAEPTVE